MGKLRILLADDHTIVCAGLAKLLEPHYEVLGSVEDGRALLKAADELNPDVVVLDIGMPLLNGLDAARELRKRKPHIKLIFLTMETDAYIAAEAFRAGAAAYLLKTSRPTELLQAIHDAARGISYVTPEIGRSIENMFGRNPTAEAPKQLTGRQREVLQM
ncbi:MAG: response regulator transcription factor, partial [Acidobacteriaceae bacterium]